MGRIATQLVSRRTLLAIGVLATLPWSLQGAQAAPKAKPAGATVSEASARFGFDLLSQMSKAGGTDPNPTVSPASLAAAFSVLDLGASPKFHTALLKTLRLDGARKGGDFPALRTALAPLIAGGKPDAPLTGVSAVYFDPQAEPKPASLAQLKQLGVQVDVRDLADPATLEAINTLVRERTKGLIPTIIDDPLQKGGLVVLNALYFKDDWRTAFDPGHTSQAGFHPLAGGDTKVAMMQSGSTNWLARQDGRFTAVALPYKTQGYELVVITTNDKPASLAEFAPVAGWLTGEGFAETKGTVALPRLSIKAGGDLRASLDALGLAPAATAPDALRKFSPKPQKIDKIIQKVVIIVDEKGTEAAAATAVTSRSLTEPASLAFVADKPFLFALRDGASGQTLMAGYIGDASKAQ